jgi:hypothetical protein
MSPEGRGGLLPDGVAGAWDLASTAPPDGALGLPYQWR